MRPVNFRLKNKHASRLFLLLCLLGVALVAWWARVAGPVEPKSALEIGRTNQTASGLSGSSYSNVNSAQPAASGVSGSGSSSTGNVINSGVPPAGGTPTNNLCRPAGGGIQPDIAYPCGCQAPGSTAYSCCGYAGGAMIACPESL